MRANLKYQNMRSKIVKNDKYSYKIWLAKIWLEMIVIFENINNLELKRRIIAQRCNFAQQSMCVDIAWSKRAEFYSYATKSEQTNKFAAYKLSVFVV